MTRSRFASPLAIARPPVVLAHSMVLFTLSPVAAQPLPVPPTDRTAVLAALDRFLDTIDKGDADAHLKLIHPQGSAAVVVYGKDGKPTLRHRQLGDFAETMRKADRRPTNERYWNPTVLIHRDIALVWTPYSFDYDGKRTHCGVDVFDLVRIGSDWKLVNATFTIELDPAGCKALGEPAA